MGKLLKVFALLVTIVLVVVVVGIFNLDRGIKAAVEGLGPDYIKAPISLNEVDLSLKTGEGALRGLVVGNPAGFKTEHAFSLGEIAVKIDTNTVTEKVIVIEKIHILRPDITYETAKNGSNIDQLQRNVNSAIGGDQGSSGDGAAAGAEDTAEAVKFVIKDLRVLEGKIHYSNPLLSGNTIDVDLPDIRLTNIGEKSNGVTGAELMEQVLAAVNRKASSAISGSGAIKELQGQLRGQVEEKTRQAVGDKLKGLFGTD